MKERKIATAASVATSSSSEEASKKKRKRKGKTFMKVNFQDKSF